MAEANTAQGQTGRQARRNKLDRRADVWEHFLSVDDVMAKCKHCGSPMNQTHGTTSMRKHLVKEFTTGHRDKKDILRCKICQREFAASDGWNHVKGCIEQEAASVGASSRPPAVQTGAPSGSDAEQGAAAAAAVGASQLTPPAQSSALSGSGASAVDVEPSALQENLKIRPVVENDAAMGASRPLPPVQARAPPGSGASSVDPEPAGLDQDEASRDLARMIALGGYDPSVVEDDYFKSFVRRLNPGFEVPSRCAIEEMCDSVFDEAKEDFLSRLRETDAEPSFSVGTAKTIEAGLVLYLACHFIDNQWNLHRMVMEAHAPLKFYYSWSVGAPLFQIDSDDLRQLEYFLQDKIKSVAAVKTHGTVFMMACGIPSLRNLRFFYDAGVDIDTTTCTDVVFHSIAQCFSSYLDSENMNAGFHIYDDVRSSHLTRQKREKLLSDRGLEHVWAHNEQWYSWYCLLEILHNEASSTSAERDSKTRQVMLKIWGEIYRAIQSISASRTATSNLYLIELFKVKEVLYSEEAGQVTELADCLTKAKKTLDNAIKDSYLLWSIPLVLDPRYKLEYIQFLFGKSFGSEAGKYISAVTKNIEEKYKLNYGDFEESSNDGEEMDIDDSQEAMTELGRYLKDSPARRKNGFDVLKWWKEYGSDLYPGVANMARDALAMPTCSKLSSEQTAQVKSIIRGYSKKADE